MTERVDLEALELVAGCAPHPEFERTILDAIAELRRLRAMEERFTWRQVRDYFDDSPEDAGEYLIFMRFEDQALGDHICVGDWWANIWTIGAPGEKRMGPAEPWYWMPMPPPPIGQGGEGE